MTLGRAGQLAFLFVALQGLTTPESAYENTGPGRFFGAKVNSSLRYGLLPVSRSPHLASSPETAPRRISRTPS